jgi:hypothetical protein
MYPMAESLRLKILQRMSSTELERGRQFSRPLSWACSEAQGALPITLPQFFWFVAGCCALHVFLRRLVTETAGIDDVDQVLRAQLWSWGYGPQPPQVLVNTFFERGDLRATSYLGVTTSRLGSVVAS